MPSRAYGRGGGGNFVKKPISATPPEASTKSSSFRSNEKVSLLKKIAHAMPGGQSRKSRASAGNQPMQDAPTGHPNPRGAHDNNFSSVPNNIVSPPPTLPRYSDPATVNISPRNRTLAINLNTITPSSSGDESGDSEHSPRPVSPNDILPFSSRQTNTDNEGTAVNEVLSPAPEAIKVFEADIVAPVRHVRPISMGDGARQRTIHPHQPDNANRRVGPKKTISTDIGMVTSSREVSSGNDPVDSDSKYKRGRRLSLGTPRIPRGTPIRRPISHLNPVNELRYLRADDPVNSWDERNATARSLPPSDPFNHLFASCALSLFLLIILALGKDILYVVALLPVLMTFAKRFLDFDQLGLYTPLMRKNLESLLSI